MRQGDSPRTRRSATPRRAALGAVLAVAAVVAVVAWPRHGFLDPARPSVSEEDSAGPPLQPSRVAAAVRMPLAPLAELLEDAVPLAYGDLDRREELPGHDRTDLAFRLRRGPFRVAISGDTATIRATVAYGVRLWYDPPVLPEVGGSCGTDPDEPSPRLTVVLRAPIAVDSTWRLRTHARVVDVRPATKTDRDRCSVTIIGVDVTDRIVEAARGFLEGHVGDIDELARGVDTRSTFAGWWDTLQEPIHLTDSLWLAMRPSSLRRGPIRGDGDSLEIGLSLTAHPRLYYGPRPDLPAVPLPHLDTGRVSDGLDLRVEARAEYDAASDFLREELVGRTFEQGGRTIRVDSLQVFGIGGGRLAVAVRVSGDVAARLYLVGTPEVDERTGRISVPDLDFDLATRNVVFAAVAWLKADALRDQLREKANFPAAPAVRFLSGWLEEGLNRRLSEDLRVEGRVDSVRILGVRALPGALLVRVGARGAARLFVVDGTGGT